VQPQILVVSDPPHREVNPDAVAAILGMDVADVRVKIKFPAPEVFAASDVDRAREFATSLRAAGMSLKIIDGHDLATIPWPVPVSSFSFGVDWLAAQVGDEDIEIPYDTPLVGVYCKPPSDFDPEPGTGLAPGDRGLAIAEAIEWSTNLDLYFSRGGEVQRLSIVQEHVDFSGLGDRSLATAEENMALTVSELEYRFHNLKLDRRLENVRPRTRLRLGDSTFELDMRKLFSFGTLLLRQVLESVEPGLGDMTQHEFGSRIAYLLSEQSGS
jgi:hypothetical protein